MTVDISNLMQNIYDFFIDVYSNLEGARPGQAFLSFEKFGITVSPNDFRLRSLDPQFSLAKAVEVTSSIADAIPQINADNFIRTGKSIEEFYQVMLAAAEFLATPSAAGVATTESLALFAQLKRRALEEFDNTLRGSMDGATKFHPVTATPSDWFDESNESNWLAQTFSVDDDRLFPAGDRLSTAMNHPWAWSVVPKELSARLRRPPRSGGLFEFLDRVVDELGHLNPMAGTVLETAGTLTQVIDSLASEESDSGTGEDLDPELIGKIGLMLLPQIKSLLGRAQTQTISSSKFKLSFKYCLVRVNRPWLSQALLFSREWFMRRHERGEFSTGTVRDNHGLFPALPTAFIVAREVNIQADFTQEDREAAERAASFGPFTLVGRTVGSKSISMSGMQIIGWICEAMPQLPPNTDPSMRPENS